MYHNPNSRSASVFSAGGSASLASYSFSRTLRRVSSLSATRLPFAL